MKYLHGTRGEIGPLTTGAITPFITGRAGAHLDWDMRHSHFRGSSFFLMFGGVRDEGFLPIWANANGVKGEMLNGQKHG